MTDHEKAVIMAYTGVVMLKGVKFRVFRKYVEDLLGRPVFTHELADEKILAEIEEKSRDDFLKLCDMYECYRCGKPCSGACYTGHQIIKTQGVCSGDNVAVYLCEDCQQQLEKWLNDKGDPNAE